MSNKGTSLTSALLCIIIGALFLISAFVSSPSIFAQASSVSHSGLTFVVSSANQSGTNNANNVLSTGLNNNTQGAILEKISDKGNYRVQLMFNESSLSLPKKGFDMEIDFLNASAPLPTAKTVPQKETATKSESSIGAGTHVGVPSIIQTNVPVDSYDIIVYSAHGQVLWKKATQPVMGGRGVERVMFTKPYSGPITIQINNIKSGHIPPNSVSFSAKLAS
jgi:hypothetical protein